MDRKTLAGFAPTVLGVRAQVLFCFVRSSASVSKAALLVRRHRGYKKFIRFTWFVVGKVLRNIKFATFFFVALFGFKGSLQVRRAVLRATQLNRGQRFASCATHAQFSGVAFAVAKAAGLFSITGVAALTRAIIGRQNPGGFCRQFCWR